MSATAGGNNLSNSSGYWGGGTPPGGAPLHAGGGFNQAQQNFINAQGKLPTAFGGDALNQAQQNFFQDKGFLPKGVGTDLGQGYYHRQPGTSAGDNKSGGQQPVASWGTPQQAASNKNIGSGGSGL